MRPDYGGFGEHPKGSPPGWPVRLSYGQIGLRPLRWRDASAWRELRLLNEEWLTPWEPSASDPWDERHTVTAYLLMLRRLRRLASIGSVLPFALTYGSELVGQITVSNIVRGALRSGAIGYWVDRGHAGRGIMTTAVALVIDHCFGPVGLHRMQADIRPENLASRRVVAKLGFREEAQYLRYLDIDGAWRDHLGYAITREECHDGLLRRVTGS